MFFPSSHRIALLFTCLVLPGFPGAASPITGYWRTIDDDSGKTKSIVHIFETGDGTLNGLVVEILHSDLGPDPLCSKCPGERRDQPIQGMVILWDMEPQSETSAANGRILDPKNGKVYKARLNLREDGNLEVRGFIGISLLGRTQVWQPAGDAP